MTYEEACLQLDNHANMPGVELPESDSLAHALRTSTNAHTPIELETFVANIISCLQAVNHEWNGPIPSKSVGPVDERVNRNVAYAVSGIICDGLEFQRRWESRSLFNPSYRSSLADAVYRIAYAWDQVLAGDVDDLLEGAALY